MNSRLKENLRVIPEISADIAADPHLAMVGTVRPCPVDLDRQSNAGALRHRSALRSLDVASLVVVHSIGVVLFGNARYASTLLSDPPISDTLLRYFDGDLWQWNVALKYNDPIGGEQKSKLQHLDYNDVRHLHVRLYFSEVDADLGPFKIFPIEVSDRVPRSSPEIGRINDDRPRMDFD